MDFSYLIVDILRWRAERTPAHTAYQFLASDGKSVGMLSYAQLWEAARSVAARLQTECASGDRVLLLYPSGKDYVVAFFGCLLAGCVAVPLYPPRKNQKTFRTNTVVEDCGAKLALSCEGLLKSIKRLQLDGIVTSLFDLIATDIANAMPSASDFIPYAIRSDDLAFLQYTSGSTGTPKGVMVSHGNLCANQAAIQSAFATDEGDVCLNWLPMFHDMGLIGAVLHPLYVGYPSLLMSTADFVRDPLCWLEALSTHSATVAGAPNFAFELLCERYQPERAGSLDLSQLRLLFSGAEPVKASTLQTFADTYSPHGLRPEVFFPCYGMAEATLFIAGASPVKPPVTRSFDAERMRSNTAVAADDGVALVSCGTISGNHHVRIVCVNSGRSLPDGSIGEIWFAGPSKTLGYWQQRELTQTTFAARLEGDDAEYLRTGDLGFIFDGELYVTGRLKNVIIIRGRNYYPHDIERTVFETSDKLSADATAAFSVSICGEEKLIVVQEVTRRAIRDNSLSDIICEARAAVSEQHGLELDDLVLIRPNTLARTTSGKIEHYRNKQRYLDGELEVIQALGQSGTPTEALMAGPVAELLREFTGQKVLTASSTLLELGLDSIRVAAVAVRLERDLGISFDLSELLDGLTLDALDEKVSRRTHRQQASIAIEPRDQWPLSALQRTIWNAWRYAPDSPVYNIGLPFVVSGEFCADRFCCTLNHVLDKYPVMTVTISDTAGEPFAMYSDQRVRLQSAQIDTLESIRSVIDVPFDLHSSLPIRLHLVETPSQRAIVLTVHHIVSDFGSLGRLFRETCDAYTALGEAPLPPPVPDWRHLAFNATFDEVDESTAQFWRSRLVDFSPLLDLPQRNARPSLRTFSGDSVDIHIDDQSRQAIKALAKSRATTPFSVLLAAYYTTLARLTSQQDLTIGLPISCNTGTAFENLPGFNINALPLRLDQPINQRFDALVDAVRSEFTALLRHRRFAAGSIPDLCQLKTDPSHAPLFQTLFTYYSDDPNSTDLGRLFSKNGESLSLGDSTLHSVKLPKQSCEVDLSVSVIETADGYAINATFNDVVYQPESVRSWIESFVAVLRGAVSQPEIDVADIALVPPSLRQRLLDWGTGKSRRPAPPRFPLAWFEQKSRQQPHAVALHNRYESVTYGQLAGRVNLISAAITACGVNPGEHVVFVGERSITVVALMLALLRLRVTYTPLDPKLPAARQQVILNEVLPKLLVQGRQTQVPYSGNSVPLDRLLQTVESAADPSPIDSHSNPAYVLYTSGSTGAPKGVAISYDNLSHFITGALEDLEPEFFRHVLAATNLAFDVSILELLCTLSAGGELTLVESLLEVPPHTGVTTVIGTNSGVRGALDAGVFAETAEWVCLLGEAVTRDVIDRLRQKSSVKRILNGYGPTECTVAATFADCAELPDQPAAIGRPISGTRALVLDARMELVPPYTLGELYLAGPGVGIGYRNNPRKTAEAFVPSCMPGSSGERMYRTGDLVYWTQDGQLVFLGRNDDQAKIHGHRVELGEIEHHLRQQDGVDRAVVLKKSDALGDQLIAFVTPASAEEQPLRAALGRTVPSYMVPARIIGLDDFPSNRSGKVDKNTLLRAAIAGKNSVAVDEPAVADPPTTETELVLAELIGELLAVSQLSRSRNLFELGATSLTAARLLGQVKSRFCVTISFRVLFESATLAELGWAIDRARRSNVADTTRPETENKVDKTEMIL